MGNYASAYCTGLLLARRVNTKLNLDYVGQEEIDGEDFNVEVDAEGKAPFKALLVGALKGACDGGLDIPHSDKRFPGSKTTSGNAFETDADTHKKYIFGGHVAEYMENLEDEDPEAFKVQFNSFIAAGIKADDLEEIYSKAHTGIRADPFKKRDPLELGRFKKRDAKAGEPVKKRFNRAKISAKQ